MSAPVAWSLAVAALLLGLPVVAATASLEVRQRAAGAADAAALAAAGWLTGEPCALAQEVAASASVELSGCHVNGLEVRIWVRAGTPLGPVEGRARAGPEISSARGP